jgi:hypothetical protein
MDAGPIEAIIAREARTLLDNLERPPSPELLQALQSLFALRHGGAFDGVIQPTIRVENDHQLIVRGLLGWSGCVEVFAAELTLAENRDTLANYVLSFGRQDAPNRKVPYDRRAELLPELRKGNWAQTFRR